jgi:PBP1b-binding outer membrane lipoprotein LpoB
MGMKRLGMMVAALAAALVMNGCSLIPGVGSQSGIQACVAIQGPLQEAGQQIVDLVQNAPSDPMAAAKAMDSLVTKLTEARGKVTNEKVGAGLDKLISAAKALSTQLKSTKGDFSKLDSTKFETAAQEFSTALSEVVAACQS